MYAKEAAISSRPIANKNSKHKRDQYLPMKFNLYLRLFWSIIRTNSLITIGLPDYNYPALNHSVDSGISISALSRK